MRATKSFLFGLFLVGLCTSSIAAPPYDVTITFTPGSGTADGFNLYVNDCAVSGATGSPAATITSGQTLPGLIVADGTYDLCVRPFNATGVQPDPGQVATINVNDLPLPGPIDNLDILVSCPNGGCTVNVVIN